MATRVINVDSSLATATNAVQIIGRGQLVEAFEVSSLPVAVIGLVGVSSGKDGDVVPLKREGAAYTLDPSERQSGLYLRYLSGAPVGIIAFALSTGE